MSDRHEESDWEVRFRQYDRPIAPPAPRSDSSQDQGSPSLPPQLNPDLERTDAPRCPDQEPKAQDALSLIAKLESGQRPEIPGVLRFGSRNQAYWRETFTLVVEYLVLQAGGRYSDSFGRGFVAWVARSPERVRLYEDGDDMTRADLVDWYLKYER
jgi:hypothetical protein